MEKICVAVRVRPLSKQQYERQGRDSAANGNGNSSSSKGNFWKVDDNHICLYSTAGGPVPGYSFSFDHVFGQDCTNSTIYEIHTKDVIEAAVQGFNGTVFAYGQTSSGKTYTMQGSEADPGIIRMAVYEVFNNIQSISDREFLIRVSYLEIYNEEINDLLTPENKKLQIHENLERGIFVAALKEEIVTNPEQVYKLIEEGEAHRHVGETNMNVRSSRSHTIFRMVIESRGKDGQSNRDSYDKDTVRVSVLNLVDLAGSERVAKTGAGGVRLKEGSHINKSLMSLGTVINKLSDGAGKQRAHIPYRDSKLTRILQPALGGNAKTAIICTVAPEEIHTDETRGTLQFASRAKKVTNCAQVNEIMTDAALLKRQKREIEELRRKLEGSHSEVLEQEILNLRNDMLKNELERERLAMQLEEERKAHQERDRRIKEQQMKIQNLSTLVITSDQERISSRSRNSLEHVNARGSSLDGLDQGKYSRNAGNEDSIDRRVTRRDRIVYDFNESQIPSSTEKQSNASIFSDGSSVPFNFTNVADEDTWITLNGGQIFTDVDFLQSTPSRKSYPVGGDIYLNRGEEEIEHLKQQLQKVLEEKHEVEKALEEQISVNSELKMTLTTMESETTVFRSISEQVSKAATNYKEDSVDISSYFKDLTMDEKDSSTILKFKISLLKLLNLMDEYKKENGDLYQQCQMLNHQLHDAMSTVMLRKNGDERHSKELEIVNGIPSPSRKVSCNPETSVAGESTLEVIPWQDTLKGIFCKLLAADKGRDQESAAIDIEQMCLSIQDESRSKSISDFVKTYRSPQEEHTDNGLSSNLNSDLANSTLLAKWLADDLKNHSQHSELYKSGPREMDSNAWRLLNAFHICCSQILERVSPVCRFQDSDISVLPIDCESDSSTAFVEPCERKPADPDGSMWEQLKMSSEHVSALDNRIALLNIEKETISRALDHELQRQEQKQLDTKFCDHLSNEFMHLSRDLAARNRIYSSIRCVVNEFQNKLHADIQQPS